MDAKFHEYTPKKININKAVAYVDGDMNFVSVKENFRRFLGVQREHECLYHLIDKDADALRQKVSSAAGKDIYFSTAILRNDGKRRNVSLKIMPVTDKGKDISYEVELLDIVNAHDYIYDLEYKVIKYKKILNTQVDMIFEYNPLDNILKVFSLKMACQELISSVNIDEFLSPAYLMALSEGEREKVILLCGALKKSESCFEYIFKENPFFKHNGDVMVKGSSVVLSENNVITVGSIADYSQGETSCFSGVGITDMMTGLLNKKAILDLARSAVNERKHEQVFLVMLDLDNFKLINDTYGHMFGDKVIKQVANILKIDIKQNGSVGRFGGDEYFMVLYNLGGEGDLRVILESIADNIQNCYKDKFKGFKLSCSMGISEYPRNGDNFDLLFKKADRGLYIAKKKGKKRYIIYKEDLHGDIDLDSNMDDYSNVFVPHTIAGDIDIYKLMRDGMAELVTKGFTGIDNLMERIISAYCLTGIRIYLGDEYSLARQWGNYAVPMPNADYMLDKQALSRFNEKDIFWENNVRYNGFYIPVIHDKLLKHNIYATVQCIIRCDDSIKGIMTFDVEQPIRNWTEEDTNYFGLLSRIVGNLYLNNNY